MAEPSFRVITPAEAPQQQPAPKLPPGQYNLFTGELEPLPIDIPDPREPGEVQVDEGIALVKTADSSQLVLSGFGLFLRKKSERLLIKKGENLIYQFPFFRLTEVVIASRGIALSSDLVEELCERGVRVSFLDSRGQPYALLSSPMLTATVQARRAQLLAFHDHRGLAFAKAVVTGKISNQERLLRYFGKYLKKADPERFLSVEQTAKALRAQRARVGEVTGTHIDEARAALMGIEGVAGRLYWEGVRAIIAERVEFFGREHRGATDAVNSLLNYGYGILYSQVWGAVLNAGLEPFAGFLHVDRPGKPSLVLDLVEEFRQPVVDRAVIAHLNIGEEVKLVQGMLDTETRRTIVDRVMERLLATETYQGRRYQIRSIIQMQARRLASFLRGEGAYKAFSFKW
jgi:CRISPR-associated protein Cas1